MEIRIGKGENMSDSHKKPEEKKSNNSNPLNESNRNSEQEKQRIIDKVRKESEKSKKQ
jgi:hypothetical protein